jgi:outer membrane lipoprotein SlyB
MSIRSVARKSVIAISLAGLSAVTLSACAEEGGPSYYPPYAEGVVAPVEEGVVVSSRPIEFGPGDTAGGTIIGGVGGAVVGSALAGPGSRGAGAVLGALGGALLGTAVASSDRVHGFAYTIRRRDGRLIEIAQADKSPIPDGVRVAVSFGPGRRARVSPENAYGPPPPGGPYGPPPQGPYPPPPPPPPGA